MRITNVGDKVLILHQDLWIGIWLVGDNVPRLPGFISVPVYMKWQNLALEATVDPRSADPDLENPPVPAVEHPEYGAPREIRQRPRPTAIKCLKDRSSEDQDVVDHSSSDNTPSTNLPPDCRPLDSAPVASDASDLTSIADDDSMSHVVTVVKALNDRDLSVSDIITVDPA
ncbi:LOW QUALITY PROTEIN: hypothetical protein PHMEG_00012824 [Phytophthora megakarya]|uniref:Reverse transcriptase n=1 Tax=Phytophthora megakarya TaxID=4795 RepID=A0A225W898_9STRA|nr:LOW QUALITY PROTEIN: hypothetical protein PHMEG_00012824 [Phytophthora megakarya]